MPARQDGVAQQRKKNSHKNMKSGVDYAHHGQGIRPGTSNVQLRVPRRVLVAVWAVINELIGAYLLILIGRGAIALIGSTSVLAAALCNMLLLIVLIATLGDNSGGHFNWASTVAITVAYWLSPNKKSKSIIDNLGSKIGWGMAYLIFYLIVQFVGGLLGAYTLEWILSFGDSTGLGTPDVLLARNTGAAIFLEIIASWVFLYVLLRTYTVSTPMNKAVLVGATYGSLLIFTLPLTLTGLNPVVFLTVGTASEDSYSDSWIFLVGPFIGAFLALVHFTLDLRVFGRPTNAMKYTGFVPYLRTPEDFKKRSKGVELDPLAGL